MSKLEGKVALVSGSGRGIGRCIALKLAAEGARVVVNDMDEAPASETVAAIRQPTVQDLLRHTSGFTYGGRGDTPVHKLWPASSGRCFSRSTW